MTWQWFGGHPRFHTAVWAFTLVTVARGVTVGDLGPRGTSRDLGPKNRELGSEVEITEIRTLLRLRGRRRSVEVGGRSKVSAESRTPNLGTINHITCEVTLLVVRMTKTAPSLDAARHYFRTQKFISSPLSALMTSISALWKSCLWCASGLVMS